MPIQRDGMVGNVVFVIGAYRNGSRVPVPHFESTGLCVCWACSYWRALHSWQKNADRMERRERLRRLRNAVKDVFPEEYKRLLDRMQVYEKEEA